MWRIRSPLVEPPREAREGLRIFWEGGRERAEGKDLSLLLMRLAFVIWVLTFIYKCVCVCVCIVQGDDNMTSKTGCVTSF